MSEAVKYGCNEWNLPDEEPIVERIIRDYDLDSARETFEGWVGDIVKVMTEEELKTILTRFLHQGDSSEFIRIELENAS